ncbi:response regulator transcription factor [Butyrivibrio sp. M55]|uniref:response regulator transcription factor n=1 Tax=Butyrivibrio sp. M55 TaxID=1855323 RepID=UPI0008DEB2AB|nr:response regulator transcription factor [Butyrivibrio sp. M55]SFU44404.1 DNA-binding response regulator, OmpR family, contains REC and winged-helix (wHTH) domain [Butyrivibrio sp. M55]
MNTTIFLLEDDDAIGMGLKYSLEKEGYVVAHATTCEEARNNWKPDEYGLAILDINLPDGNGYDICKMIKKSGNVPVIFLTASDAEVNVVMGLELGADDYICKPFRVNELMARIRAVLRRSSATNANNQGDSGQSDNTQNSNPALRTTTTMATVKLANITIYTNEAKVTRLKSGTETEETIELTALEYRLLLAFCNNRGIVLSRKSLLEDMWDVSGDFVNDNTLTVYIKRLRDKIEEDPTNPQIIKTVRGLGYIVM